MTLTIRERLKVLRLNDGMIDLLKSGRYIVILSDTAQVSYGMNFWSPPFFHFAR